MFQLALAAPMAPDVHLHVAHAQRESRVTQLPEIVLVGALPDLLARRALPVCN